MGLEPFHAYASILAGDAVTPYGSLRTRPLGSARYSPDAVLAENRERFGVARGITEMRLSNLLLTSTRLPATGPGALGARRAAAEDEA